MYEDGATYMGTFALDDREHGDGIMCTTDGSKYEGKWNSG